MMSKRNRHFFAVSLPCSSLMIPIVIASIAFLSLSRSLKNFIPQPFENAAARYRNGMAEGNTFVPQSSIDMMNSMGKKLAKTAVNLITVESLLKSNMHAAFSDDLIDDELVDLNIKEPAVTDTCFLDISVGGSNRTQRIEVGIYGEVTPVAAANFKSLCRNTLGWGYQGSNIFRIISTFSVQGGNIGQPPGTVQSQMCKFGKSGLVGVNVEGFPAENYRIMHSCKDAGVISMMKNVNNRGYQDSRFFITTSPNASWADGRYCAFGRVTKGMDIIQALQLLPVQPPTNYPVISVKIASAGCY